MYKISDKDTDVQIERVDTIRDLGILIDEKLKRCVHKLSKSQKVDLSKSQLKLWTCKRLKFN